MSTTETTEAAIDGITRDNLTDALTEFYLPVRTHRGYQESGQVAHPGEVADVLYATLSRIAAERRPDVPAETTQTTAEQERDEARDQLTKADELIRRLERITTAWTRGMYSARIDCWRGDAKAAAGCLSEGLDGYDGPEWDGTETGAEWWERTKAEEGL